MSQPTLRKLARKYADGTLAKEEYRVSRAALLEGILAGKIRLQVNEYRPLIAAPEQDELLDRKEEQNDITQLRTEASPAPTPAATAPGPVTKTPANRRRFVMIGAAALSLLVLVVLASALLPDARQSVPGKDPAGGETASAEPGTVGNVAFGAAQALIQEFLDKKDWSDAGLNSFKAQWQKLTPAQQAAATGTMQLSQLKNTIYKKLLEERALSGLGDDEQALNKQRRLVEFAENIGINDPRIRLPSGVKP